MGKKEFDRSKSSTLHIPRLHSGGLITNYVCSSRCKHCLYASSPQREKNYIDKETASRVFRKTIALGCRSLHIGGGEPLLQPDKLKMVLHAASKEGMSIQYVETNSSWFQDHKRAVLLLKDLQRAGLSCLLVSISPFHNESIPFYKVKGVMAACRETGVSIFPWIMDFYRDIDSFSDDRTHSLSEYLDKYGPDYLKKILRTYWIHPGGRVFNSFQSIYGKRAFKDLLTDNTGCMELTETSHFHFDLYENYIPGLCSGLQIHYQDMGAPLSQRKYPYLYILYNYGINGFYRLALEEFGFQPRETYANKCHLCLDIRRYLVRDRQLSTAEFGPIGFYREEI